MLKKIPYIFMILLLLALGLPSGQTAQAAQLVTGTFVDVTYSEYANTNGEIEKALSKITLQNANGRTVTYNINNNTRLYINNTETSIEGFKMGMKVEAEVSLRNVVELRGTSNTSEETTTVVQNATTIAGVVTSIDPNGMFIMVKPDIGQETTYYINKDTSYQKKLIVC